MKSELWRRLETVFNRALEIDDAQRDLYLKTTCEGEPEILREAESLLRAYENPRGFIDKPIFTFGLRALGKENFETPKPKLGRYEIIKPIGMGGMGEVFLAHDTLLDRLVALKLLPTFLTSDPQSIQRFQQEAHAASTISHPNVAHIYEIGVEEKCYFTSMEYVEGHTLRKVLDNGRLSVKQALDIAIQIARALESAHAAGVIHRDIKPENIMIRPDGYVKVLDFGLAKLDRMMSADSPHQTQVSHLVLTEPGLIMGSPAYMSPEQARGVGIDARTDIWSLGVVLYEMLCGWTPFQGSTRMDVIVALLREEPAPISVHLRHAHFGLRKLVKRMLSKDKDQRYLTITEVINDLQSLTRDLRWNAEHQSEARLFQGSRLAFLKNQVLLGYRARESTVVKGIAPWFVGTLLMGLLLTAVVKTSTNHRKFESNSEAERQYQKGVAAMLRDDFYTAAVELNAASQWPENARSLMIHARLAEVWAELDYSERAVLEFQQLEMRIEFREKYKDVSDVELGYINAARATTNRDFRLAISVYRHIVENDPQNAIAWMDLGRSYERMHWLNEATYCYTQAAIKAPSLAPAFLRLGVVEGLRKNEREAEFSLGVATQLYGVVHDEDGVLETLSQKIILAYRLGQHDKALAYEKDLDRLQRVNVYQDLRRKFAIINTLSSQEEAKSIENEARNHADIVSRAGVVFKGPDQILVNGFLDIAFSYLRKNDLLNAQPYILEARKIAERSDLKIGRAKAAYAWAQQDLHEGFPENADAELKQVLRIELPNAELSDRSIALWRSTIFDRDYDEAIDSFRTSTYH